MKTTYISIILSASILWLCTILSSCNTKQAGSHNTTTDSTEIVHIMQAAYKWHDHIKDKEPYTVIVKDTLQVGLDMVQVAMTANEWSGTGYFTQDFIENYQAIGRKIDNILRHDTVKYYNEINFSFQDSDPWNFFQDDAGNYWDSFIVRDMKINADSASLKWTLNGIDEQDGYLVKFKHEKDGWKISYMTGFDVEQI